MGSGMQFPSVTPQR